MTDVTKKRKKKFYDQKKKLPPVGSNLASLVRERRDIDWEHTSTLHRQAEDGSVSLGFYGRFAGGCWNVFNFCLWTCGVCWNGVESCVWPLDFGNKFELKKSLKFDLLGIPCYAKDTDQWDLLYGYL